MIKNNLSYPKVAQRNNVEGTVYIEFWVDETGQIMDTKIHRKLGYGCDEEALRILYSAPRWIPGQKRGVNTKIRMILPIRFQLT